MAQTHYFPSDRVHFTWDTGNEPVIAVESGDIWSSIRATSAITRSRPTRRRTPSRASTGIASTRWRARSPSTAPQPGDTLAVEVLDLHTQGWGWTAILPGLGLLPDDFPDPYLRIFDLTAGDVTYLRDDIAIPIEPFLGTMGVCPADASAQSDHAAGELRRQHGHPPAHPRARRCTCPCRSRARCSAAATRTPPRATARSA